METTAIRHQPFSELPLQEGTLLQRLLGRRLRENAWIEVNNLLASAESVRDVRPEQVAWVSAKYNMPFRGELCGRLERLYRDYLLYCLADRRLSPEELNDLAHLKRILRLTDRAMAGIHESVARQVYEQSVDEALSDGRIDAAEREFLNALQQHLALPGKVVARIMAAKKLQLEDAARAAL